MPRAGTSLLVAGSPSNEASTTSSPGIGYIASTAHERNRKRLEERAAAAT